MPSDKELALATTNTNTNVKTIPENTDHDLNNQTNNNNRDEEENEDSDFSSKPSKIMKLEDNQGENCDERLTLNKIHHLPEQELRLELFKLLKKFFKCAFTIIIKMRRLCPTDGFEIIRVLGVNVPRFTHPSSLEYVEEVSKKLILFLHRNSSEGCAIHIMIEKNKTLHVVQRFVFRTMGSLDVPSEGDIDENAINLEEVKIRCKASLLQILHSDKIKPMTAPQYSRWSISIGLQSELVENEQMEQLWASDPSGNYFPWKKRLRSLASIQKKENEGSIASKIATSSRRNGDDISSRPYGLTEQTKEGCEITNPEHSNDIESNDLNTVDKKSAINTNQLKSDSDNDYVKNSKNRNNDAGTIICFPLSSFPITSNFMLSIYGLEYPAPVNSSVQNHTFSPRITRNPHISLRLSQFRNRLLRSSRNEI